MSQFDELLAQLNSEQEEQSKLAKALPAEGGEDDEAIQAAAAEGAEGEDTNPEDNDGADDEPTLTKSLKVGDEEIEVVDADQLIKSINGLTERTGAVETVLTKALESTLSTIKAQGEMIKSLSAKVEKLSRQGAGRKAVLSIQEKPETELKKSQSDEEGMTTAEFFAKAQSAYSAGKISGQELTTIDVAIRYHDQLDKALINKVLQA